MSACCDVKCLTYKCDVWLSFPLQIKGQWWSLDYTVTEGECPPSEFQVTEAPQTAPSSSSSKLALMFVSALVSALVAIAL